MPPKKAPAKAADDDLPDSSEDEDVEKALLGEGDKKAAASDAGPLSPRDKMKGKSKDTPLTPRSAQKKLDEAAKDPKAAAAAGLSALEDAAAADPAAAKALAAAKAAAEDPEAAAKAALEAAKNMKAPTAEELKAAQEGYKKEAEALAATAKQLWEDMMNDRPPPIWPMEELSKRMERYIDLLDEIPQDKLPPAVAPHLKPTVKMVVKVCAASSGWFMFIFRWVNRIYTILPINVTKIMFGAALCYFGGTFTTSIAAMEAFRTMGYEQASRDVGIVIEQIKPVLAANDADDEEDLDGDGIADVDQITPPQLLQRKLFLIATSVKEPERIQDAVRSVYAALLAVLATLKMEFAQTTAMAMGVADMAKKPLIRLGKPKLEMVLPPETHHWIVPSIDSIVRFTAIAAAWFLQQIISAFYSALRGGKLVAEGLFGILVEKAKVGVVLCPGMVGVDYDPDDSILDDVIGWIVAAQGFMFQINSGFQLPAPFNIIFFPLTFLEWYLRFQIAGGTTTTRQLQELAELNATCTVAGSEDQFGLSGLMQNMTMADMPMAVEESISWWGFDDWGG